MRGAAGTLHRDADFKRYASEHREAVGGNCAEPVAGQPLNAKAARSRRR